MGAKKVDFSTGNIPKIVLRTSIPMIMAEIVHLLYNMVDRIYIGHIPENGSLALTGLGICFPIIAIFTAFGRLFGSNGGAPLLSMELGKGNTEEAGKIMGSAFTLSLYTGLFFMFFLIICKRPLLYAFGASDVTYPFAEKYLTIYALGSIPVLLTLSMNPFITGQGFSVMGMATTVIGAVLNIILDPLFIFVLNMGVEGAAVATVISQTISMIFVLSFLVGKSPEVRIEKRYMKLEKKRSIRIMGLGMSGFTMGATNSIVQIVCNKMALLYGGDLYVGVMTILNSIRDIFATPLLGIGSGATPVMSYNYGMGDGKRVKSASNSMLYYTLLISALTWIIVFLFPSQLSGIFTTDQALIDASVYSLQIYFFGFIFMSFQTTAQQTFVGLGKAKRATFFSLFRKVIIVVPLTLILPKFFGIDGVMLAEPISNLIGGGAAYTTMRLTVFRELSQLDEKRSAKA